MSENKTKRNSILFFGDADVFVNKIPSKKKSLVLNTIVVEFLKEKEAAKKLLSTFFTEEEINFLLDEGKKVELESFDKKETSDDSDEFKIEL